MEGALCVPILRQGEIRGTLGISKPVEYEFDRDEVRLLLEIGALLGEYLER